MAPSANSHKEFKPLQNPPAFRIRSYEIFKGERFTRIYDLINILFDDETSALGHRYYDLTLLLVNLITVLADKVWPRGQRLSANSGGFMPSLGDDGALAPEQRLRYQRS